MALDSYERSRSLAIAPDDQRFLLGTSWSLRLFDREGEEQWRVEAPGTAWAVNVSGDGRLAVAAFDDGTIRWYRMADGEELLALFPHADGRRWVLWTPEGYFDGSAGADALIGWHVNRGWDQAPDFFPAARFRDAFYRPDVIARVLEAGDVEAALREADTAAERPTVRPPDVATILPPVVEILEPADEARVAEPEVVVTYLLRSPSGEPVTRIRALVDGREASVLQKRFEPGDDGVIRRMFVPVPPEDAVLSLIAESANGASEPATVRVVWAGRAAAPDPTKPVLYVLAIGVNEYGNHPNLNLDYTDNDAREFVDALARQKGGLYRDVRTRLLIGEEATKEAILDGLEWIDRETTSRDVAVVFFSGHGRSDARGNYYFMPHDVDVADTYRLRRTAVQYDDMKLSLTALAAKAKALFFVDSCHAGDVLPGRKAVPPNVDQVANDLAAAESGVVVLSSSTGSQFSVEDPKWENGAFTEALLEALDGAGDLFPPGEPDSVITVRELDASLAERVKELTRGEQTPTVTAPESIPNFPVAIAGARRS